VEPFRFSPPVLRTPHTESIAFVYRLTDAVREYSRTLALALRTVSVAQLPRQLTLGVEQFATEQFSISAEVEHGCGTSTLVGDRKLLRGLTGLNLAEPDVGGA
jgi:hypothetical protein